MPVPVVEFTDERLANGLRLIVAEDHLAPVAAVNVWYDVGSKHEVIGKTGFAHLFPVEHPYHHPTIGSMEDLDAASLEDVKAFFRTWYAPNNAVLSVVGDVDTAAVRASVERFFGAIPANPAIPTLPDLSLPPTLGGERREVVHDRVPLPRIYLGFRAPAYGDPRLDALDVAGQILAGGKGSRLHRRLVRDERVAQDVALFTLGFIGGASVCAGWVTVRPDVSVDRVEAAFHEELDRLVLEPVSDDELARAFALIEADELGALQRVEERADRLSMYATLFDDPGLINRMLPRYLAVTPDAIREVAAATFRPDNRLVLTYLPESPPAETNALDETDETGDEEVAA